MDSTQPRINFDSLYYFPRQKIIVEDFDAAGLILDIGAGGQGVIGRMKGGQVVAIDSIRSELEASPPGPLKIVMDAVNLQFIDCSFSTATLFCTLLYAREHEQERIIQEAYRVLVPGGRLLVWDFNFPTTQDPTREIAAFPVSICLPDYDEISAGYGTQWPESNHDLDYYARLAQSCGFVVNVRREKEQMLYMEFQKPLALLDM
jgi:ubiquinone/menaquinone biosynthesis C-methylase UbiE